MVADLLNRTDHFTGSYITSQRALRESPQESRLLSNTKEERQHTFSYKTEKRRGWVEDARERERNIQKGEETEH